MQKKKKKRKAAPKKKKKRKEKKERKKEKRKISCILEFAFIYQSVLELFLVLSRGIVCV